MGPMHLQRWAKAPVADCHGNGNSGRAAHNYLWAENTEALILGRVYMYGVLKLLDRFGGMSECFGGVGWCLKVFRTV